MQNQKDILKHGKYLWMFIKNNFVIFLCLLYLFTSLHEILASENIRINGVIYSKFSYSFYAFI